MKKLFSKKVKKQRSPFELYFDFLRFNKKTVKQIKEENILNVLKSPRFKKSYYAANNITDDKPISTTLISWIKFQYNKFLNRFKDKNLIENMMERMDAVNKLTDLERRERMVKYGMTALLKRDDADLQEESDPVDLKNKLNELMNYRKELTDFMGDDADYKALLEKEEKMTSTIMWGIKVPLIDDTHGAFVSSLSSGTSW